MSFKSTDLMVDVLPGRKFNAPVPPGLLLCGAVSSGQDEEDEDEDDLQCTALSAGPTTGNDPASVFQESGLALLRRQLRETLSA